MGRLMAKAFLTIDSQMDLLTSRGLLIEDREEARAFLLQNNYYRISGYSLTLRKNDVFYPGTSMRNIMDIYFYDWELRNLLLYYIEIIEVKLKSIYAYHFAEKFGPVAYRSEALFLDRKRHASIMAKMDAQKEKRLEHEAYLKHFINDLHEEVPIWAAVDLFTIADISMLYSISEEDLKDRVLRDYQLGPYVKTYVLEKIMHSMTIIRNLCAHGSRLFNRLFEQRPTLNSKERATLRIKPDGTPDNEHLFGFLLIMKRLIPDRIESFKGELKNLCERYPFVDLKHYGFPENWENVL